MISSTVLRNKIIYRVKRDLRTCILNDKYNIISKD